MSGHMPAAERTGRPSLVARLRNHIGLHFHILTTTLQHYGRAPLAQLLTALVIGIALTLPMVLYVAVTKLQTLSGAWQHSGQISLFLKAEAETRQVEAMARRLRGNSDVLKVEVITPEQALAEFRRNSGLDQALELLDENPLPYVLIVHPRAAVEAPQRVEQLLQQLKQEALVEIAQVDTGWLQRLHALMGVIERIVWVLAALLAGAVLFVVGNTIRLAIHARQDEIQVTKLIGGSDAFVRRPFLYMGVWFGLFGALVAWGLVNGILVWLDAPVRQLAGLYQSDFHLGMLDVPTTLILLGTGPLLGWLGAWLTATWRIRAIEPR